MAGYYLFRLAGWLFPRLPLGFLRWAADRVGWLAFHTSGSRRQIVTANLRHVLGVHADQAQLERAVAGVFRLWMRNQVEFFLLPNLATSEVKRLVSLEGWEHVEAARARGKGLIISSIHFGTPDTTIQILAARGLLPVVLHEKLEPPALYEYVSSMRASHGLVFAPVGDASTLKLVYRTLRANGVVGVAADRDVTGSGRVVEFFGAPARLPDGHVTLARRTGAAIVMTYCHLKPDSTYTIAIEPPIIVAQTSQAEADIEDGMRKVVTSMERVLGANPEQWVYFHPVWLDAQAPKDMS